MEGRWATIPPTNSAEDPFWVFGVGVGRELEGLDTMGL